MPKRKTNIRVPTPEIQGEDSYVVYRPLKVGEARSMQKRAEEATEEAAEEGLREVSDHVLGWNWVDDKGAPMEVPSKDSEVLDDLTVEELEFLTDLLLGGLSERKN